MMVNLMALSLELMMNRIILVSQPFSLGVRVICFVTRIWLHLLKAIVNFHVDLCWKIVIWALAFVSLPVRILTAVQRERLLEIHLHDMRIELENLAWNKKELDERLQIMIKDRKILASVLEELEEEHDKAIAKIELLENELQDLKVENQRLKEMQRKGKWDFKAQVAHDDHDKHSIPLRTEYESLLKSGYNGSGVIIEDLLMQKDAWDDTIKGRGQSQELSKLESKGSGLVYPLPQAVTPSFVSIDEALNRRREVAFSQSVFSASLSLLVGMIAWKAEDPCMPLVVALFTVVGMSLKSVVQFFSTIKNRPASDAVSLLSFNWFILGTLSYPTLPKVANVAIPLAVSLTQRIIIWLGFSSLLQIE